MTTILEKMICQRCGSEMNHHADKLVYSAESAVEHVTSDEVIFQFHACPVCGACAVRLA